MTETKLNLEATLEEVSDPDAMKALEEAWDGIDQNHLYSYEEVFGVPQRNLQNSPSF